jgi:hypothetical protein
MSLAFPASPTTGQIYQGWKWSGSSWDPNYAANFVTSFNGRAGAVVSQPGDTASGNRVLIATQTVSAAVAAVTFTGLGAYDDYEMDCLNLRANVDSGGGFQFSNDGTTWLTSGYYYGYNYVNSGNAGAFGGSAAGVLIACPALIGGAANYTGFVFARFPRVTGTLYKHGSFEQFGFSGSSSFVYGAVGGAWAGTAPPNPPTTAIRFIANSPNTLTSGIFNLYGKAK